MARYPDAPRPQIPYPFRNNRPFVGGGPEWAPQRRNLTRFGLAEADLSYRGNTWAEIQTLYAFFDAVGASGRFTFVDFNGIDEGGRGWLKLFVAQGTGAIGTWDLPTYALVASPAPVVYENGTAKTTSVWVSGSTTPAAGSYLIVPGTGTDGVDTLNAGTDPADGVIVTIDATCRRAFRRSLFTTAKNPFSWDSFSGAQGPVTIIEVRK